MAADLEFKNLEFDPCNFYILNVKGLNPLRSQAHRINGDRIPYMSAKPLSSRQTLHPFLEEDTLAVRYNIVSATLIKLSYIELGIRNPGPGLGSALWLLNDCF